MEVSPASESIRSERLYSATLRLLLRNPALFVPPAIAAALQMFAAVAIFLVLASQLTAKFTRILRAGGEDFQRMLPGVVFQSAGYALTMALFLFAAFQVLRWIHGAGWGLMMARAASTGGASLADYLEGVGAFAPRVAWAWLLRLCLFFMPVTCLCLFAVSLLELNTGGGIAAGIVFWVMPLVILVQAAMVAGLWMWRPACFTDDMPVVESFRRSLAYASTRPGRLLGAFAAWGVLTGSIAGAFLLFQILLGLMVDFEALSPLLMAADFSLGIIAAGLIGAVSVFFHLLFFMMYAEESRDGILSPSPRGATASAPTEESLVKTLPGIV